MNDFESRIQAVMALEDRVAALEASVRALEEVCLPQESDDPAFHTPVREAHEPSK